MGRSIFVAIVASMIATSARAQATGDSAATASFTGVVLDSTDRPISGASVSFPELAKATLTDEQGAFALHGIPAGSQHVVVRHVGYGPIDAQVTFVAGRTTPRRFWMARATTLDSVVVTEKVVDHALDDFEANRKAGLGHFLTRAELAKQEGRSTGAVLTSMPGIKVFAFGPHAWVGSGRHNLTSLQPSVGLDDSDAQKGAPLWDCYALVYVDDHLVFRGQKFPNAGGRGGARDRWEPLFDVNSIPVAEIEAIQYYATSAETPMKYASLNSACGVLVIHTIRYHPRDTSTVRTRP